MCNVTYRGNASLLSCEKRNLLIQFYNIFFYVARQRKRGTTKNLKGLNVANILYTRLLFYT